MKHSALNLSLCALASCLICLCSWIAIPLGGVPMTLQTFGVAFCGFLLGARGGVCAVAVYLALGAVGLPVFAGFGASLAFLAGPTGGFLVGFLLLALLCGLADRSRKRATPAGGCSPTEAQPVSKQCKRRGSFCAIFLSALGLLACHLLGVLWFARVTRISLSQAFLLSSMPYLPKDVLSLLFARLLCQRIRKRLPRSAR